LRKPRDCFSPISPETCPLVQSFLCPSRTFLMDGHVQLKTGLQTQERHLFLFTDILVVAKPKSHLHFKLKSQARLCDMWTASCLEEVCEGSTDLEKSFVLGWPTTNCVASFSSIEQKEKWLTFLQRYFCFEEKEKDYPKSIPLKIIAKDIGSCAYSKTLTINNTDTASDIVLMALQQLGINGSEKEYQLWVNSGREDAPYPLIGHEYPFGIKMSHIRDTLPQTQESKDCVCPLEVQEAILIEQLPRERQCQFVIKPRRLATGHELNECSQKPLKRKRSTINWAFWRGAEAPPSPTSAQGKLFGHPLPDKLPKPIFDMLSFLNQEGPFTEGIFRRSASAKSCRELKEKLDSGAEVNLLSESILVIASVLKDFLRNIPGSVFSSQLCDQWVSLMDEGNDEEKIKSTHRLMEQLPGANVMLLRYLFGVLHSIERQSEDNKMTAFNLAVCIGPSLLWLPAATNSWTEEEFTMKIFNAFLWETVHLCSPRLPSKAVRPRLRGPLRKQRQRCRCLRTGASMPKPARAEISAPRLPAPPPGIGASSQCRAAAEASPPAAWDRGIVPMPGGGGRRSRPPPPGIGASSRWRAAEEAFPPPPPPGIGASSRWRAAGGGVPAPPPGIGASSRWRAVAEAFPPRPASGHRSEARRRREEVSPPRHQASEEVQGQRGRRAALPRCPGDFPMGCRLVKQAHREIRFAKRLQNGKPFRLAGFPSCEAFVLRGTTVP
uniref:Rho GTPase-activating protein 20 n=1 Tax=Podarcis muralis TaxID=64176 RepID=A0A670HXA1_PODMU